jgi:ribosomal protein L11 methyltransferase
MPWLSLVVEVDAAVADPLCDALLAHGAAAASVEDALAGTPAEEPVFDEPGAGARPIWARARIRALLPAETDAAEVLRDAAAAAGLRTPPSAFAFEPLADQDWLRHVQSQFEPIRVTSRLWIVPSWHAVPDPRAVHIQLDPGLAFGTGSHASTRACLRWLERHVFPGARVLDYGCGSGILAIAAMKLGAGDAVGVDIDADALAAARANATRNGARARFADPHAPLDFTADLVVANILANPLQVLAPLLATHCRPAGRIALAGILEHQAEDVARAYAPWFEMAECEREEGWVALEGVRR